MLLLLRLLLLLLKVVVVVIKSWNVAEELIDVVNLDVAHVHEGGVVGVKDRQRPPLHQQRRNARNVRRTAPLLRPIAASSHTLRLVLLVWVLMLRHWGGGWRWVLGRSHGMVQLWRGRGVAQLTLSMLLKRQLVLHILVLLVLVRRRMHGWLRHVAHTNIAIVLLLLLLLLLLLQLLLLLLKQLLLALLEAF